MTDTPVVVFTYDRPTHAARVLARVRAADPPRLLVVSDGAPPDSEEAQRRVSETRSLVIERQFPFPVETEFADRNLGLRDRFVTGLSWVFDRVPEAIILEEDTVPDLSFFPYCDVLLERYRDDPRVFDITGRNGLGKWDESSDYHFSYHGSIWGWATWRDSWEEYDPDMTDWTDPEVRRAIRKRLDDGAIWRYVRRLYNRTHSGEIETWDYQWGFARQRTGGVSAVPRVNLVQNVGFDDYATNTTRQHGRLVSTGALTTPLSHPDTVAVDHDFDREVHKRRPARWRSIPVLGELLDRLG